MFVHKARERSHSSALVLNVLQPESSMLPLALRCQGLCDLGVCGGFQAHAAALMCGLCFTSFVAKLWGTSLADCVALSLPNADSQNVIERALIIWLFCSKAFSPAHSRPGSMHTHMQHGSIGLLDATLVGHLHD